MGDPAMKRATSHPSSGTKAVTSGPSPTSNARLPAAYSTARSMPSSSVLAPPMRRTKTPPSTSTLKFRFVIPPPSSSTFAARPGHSLATAAWAASTSPGSYLLEWPRDGPPPFHRSGARGAAFHIRPARHHERPPGDGGPRQGLRALGRQRQALHRLRRRHRGEERRPLSPPRQETRPGPARARDPHLLPGGALRVLPPPRPAHMR